MKVTHCLTRVSACSQTATTMLLMLEGVKATHWYTRVTACSQRATSMPLIFARSDSENDSLVDGSPGMEVAVWLHAETLANKINELLSLSLPAE